MSTETKTPREQAEEIIRGVLAYEDRTIAYRDNKLRAIDLLTTALTGWQLVPIEECGELEDGDYVTRDEGETELNVKLLRNGRWYGANNLEAPTHIINPSFGPLPEVGR